MRSQVLLYLSFLLLNISSLVHVSLALPIAPHKKPIGNVDPLLKKWCDTSSYPHLCLSTIAPRIRGKPALPVALDIAIKAAIGFTEKSIAVAKDIAKKPPPSVKADILNDAVENLGSGLSSYKQAQVFLNKHQYEEINNQLSAAYSSISSALEPFAPDPDAKEISVPRLTSMLHKCNKLIETCLALDVLNYPRPM